MRDNQNKKILQEAQRRLKQERTQQNSCLRITKLDVKEVFGKESHIWPKNDQEYPILVSQKLNLKGMTLRHHFVSFY